MSVGRICCREVDLAEARESVRAAAERMAARAVGTVVVVDPARRPLGLLTDRDVVVRVVAPGLDPGRVRVEQVMTRDPVRASEDEPIEQALERMRAHGVRRLPVVAADGSLAGILSLDDVLELLGEEMRSVSGLLAGAGAARRARAAREVGRG